jgi:hypothetical protein
MYKVENYSGMKRCGCGERMGFFGYRDGDVPEYECPECGYNTITGKPE